jgi:hypothetical protein
MEYEKRYAYEETKENVFKSLVAFYTMAHYKELSAHTGKMEKSKQYVL